MATHIYSSMRTQKLPVLSKASGTLTFSLLFLHYDLIYGVSVAKKRDSLNICLVNYYLVYGISETTARAWWCHWWMNYCLVYGTSETKISTQASTPTVNYCLIYGTSETKYTCDGKGRWWTTTWITVPPKHADIILTIKTGWTTAWFTRTSGNQTHVLFWCNMVNYYLDYRTSETEQ